MRNLVKCFFIPFIILFCLLDTPLLSYQRGMKIVAKDPETGEELNLYDDSWAIVIGINKYEFVTHLDYAVSDAISFKKLLIEKFGFSENHIEFLTDEKATVQGIKKAFQNITKKSEENDRVIVFYAGHGETEKLPTGGEMGYLIPVDGKIDELYLTCLPMQEIKTLSQMLPAKHVLFLVDACYGGLAAVQRRSLDRQTKGFLKKITKARARQILTAGSKEEQVIEKPEWGHSAFTYKLLDGLERELADLDDDGFITASELGIYIKSSVSKISDNYQTPQLKSLSGDEGEFVFLLKKDIIISETQTPEFQPKTFEGFGDFYITSEPSGAKVWIDEKEISGITPLLAETITSGYHKIKVEKGDYTAESFAQLNVDEMKKINLMLELGSGMIKVITTPFEAIISLDRTFEGKSPITLKDIKAGWHEITIKKDGYSTIIKQIKVESNKTEEVRVNLPELAMLSINSEPTGASVLIDRKASGKTPFSKKLDSGNYEVKLEKQECFDNDFSIELAPGDKKDFQISLRTCMGIFSIISKPSNAEVLINGIKKGLTPFDIRLKEGNYNITLRKQDHYKKELTEELNAEEEKKINIDLERHKGNLDIKSNPSLAEVFVDGKTIGHTPLKASDLTTGTHKLEIRKKAYFPQEQSVKVKVDALKSLNFDLISHASINLKLRRLNTTKYLWLCGSIISGAVGGYFKYSAEKHYDEYKTATTQATDLHKKIEMEDKIYSLAFGISAVCLIPTLLNHFKQSALKKKFDLSVVPKDGGISITMKIKW